MLDPAFVMLCLVILAALLFDYINGFHDTANAIATDAQGNVYGAEVGPRTLKRYVKK